jgi:hypothetical protein
MTDPSTMDPQIRAVLDSSGIRSYAIGHVHVGEMMGEVLSERGYIGVPATALLDAHVHFLDDKLATARLGVLVHLPVVRVLDLDATSAVAVADVVPFTEGDLARAHAIWAALEHSAMFLTREPDRAARAVAKDRTIVIPAEDA